MPNEERHKLYESLIPCSGWLKLSGRPRGLFSLSIFAPKQKIKTILKTQTDLKFFFYLFKLLHAVERARVKLSLSGHDKATWPLWSSRISFNSTSYLFPPFVARMIVHKVKKVCSLFQKHFWPTSLCCIGFSTAAKGKDGEKEETIHSVHGRRQ